MADNVENKDNFSNDEARVNSASAPGGRITQEADTAQHVNMAAPSMSDEAAAAAALLARLPPGHYIQSQPNHNLLAIPWQQPYQATAWVHPYGDQIQQMAAHNMPLYHPGMIYGNPHGPIFVSPDLSTHPAANLGYAAPLLQNAGNWYGGPLLVTAAETQAGSGVGDEPGTAAIVIEPEQNHQAPDELVSESASPHELDFDSVDSDNDGVYDDRNGIPAHQHGWDSTAWAYDETRDEEAAYWHKAPSGGVDTSAAAATNPAQVTLEKPQQVAQQGQTGEDLNQAVLQAQQQATSSQVAQAVALNCPMPCCQQLFANANANTGHVPSGQQQQAVAPVSPVMPTGCPLPKPSSSAPVDLGYQPVPSGYLAPGSYDHQKPDAYDQDYQPSPFGTRGPVYSRVHYGPVVLPVAGPQQWTAIQQASGAVGQAPPPLSPPPQARQLVPAAGTTTSSLAVLRAPPGLYCAPVNAGAGVQRPELGFIVVNGTFYPAPAGPTGNPAYPGQMYPPAGVPIVSPPGAPVLLATSRSQTPTMALASPGLLSGQVSYDSAISSTLNPIPVDPTTLKLRLPPLPLEPPTPPQPRKLYRVWIEGIQRRTSELDMWIYFMAHYGGVFSVKILRRRRVIRALALNPDAPLEDGGGDRSSAWRDPSSRARDWPDPTDLSQATFDGLHVGFVEFGEEATARRAIRDLGGCGFRARLDSEPPLDPLAVHFENLPSGYGTEELCKMLYEEIANVYPVQDQNPARALSIVRNLESGAGFARMENENEALNLIRAIHGKVIPGCQRPIEARYAYRFSKRVAQNLLQSDIQDPRAFGYNAEELDHGLIIGNNFCWMTMPCGYDTAYVQAHLLRVVWVPNTLTDDRDVAYLPILVYRDQPPLVGVPNDAHSAFVGVAFDGFVHVQQDAGAGGGAAPPSLDNLPPPVIEFDVTDVTIPLLAYPTFETLVAPKCESDSE